MSNPWTGFTSICHPIPWLKHPHFYFVLRGKVPSKECTCTYLIKIKGAPKYVLSGNAGIVKLSVLCCNIGEAKALNNPSPFIWRLEHLTNDVGLYKFLKELWLYKVFIALLNKPSCQTTPYLYLKTICAVVDNLGCQTNSYCNLETGSNLSCPKNCYLLSFSYFQVICVEGGIYKISLEPVMFE